MKEVFYLGSLGFAQLGMELYKAKSAIEKEVLFKVLNDKFGRRVKTSGGRLVWAAHRHDYGTYHEMEFHIDSDNINQRVYDLVNDMECDGCWNDQELYQQCQDIFNNTVPKAAEKKKSELDELDKTIRSLEDKGAIITMPETVEKELAEKEEKVEQVKSQGTFKQVDIDDYDMMEFLSASVVPACCVYGCEVEPDGKCEHGNPSVLLNLGMI